MKISTFFSLIFNCVLFTTQAQLTNYNVGDIAPDIRITDILGQSHTLYQYTDSGKYVLLDFFGYWCGSCRTKAPIIQTFYNKYGCNQHEVVVLGIEGDGTNAQLLEFDSLAGISSNSYPACSGLEGNGDSVHLLFGILGLPTLVIIGPDRKIITENITPSNTAPEILAAFPENSVQVHSCDPLYIVAHSPSTITLYPNPTTGKIILTINSEAHNTSYSIADITGKIIFNGELQKPISEIDLSHLIDGFYLIIINNELKSRIKIVKANW